ncbi:MAG: acyl--CoA ligase [Chloroflexi bacterium]|nr:MAG: acyl--CoA ligase [Chloroflexota bacterium]
MMEKMVASELFRPPVDFPDVPYDHLVRMAAERTPDRPAILYHNLILTYREVVSMINCIANGLHDIGLRKGDRLCLFTTNRPEYTLTFFAAASIGAVVSPMTAAPRSYSATSAEPATFTTSQTCFSHWHAGARWLAECYSYCYADALLVT